MADKVSAEDLGKMKVTELKKALKERGLPLTGTKSELLDRLKSAVEAEEATVETTAAIEDSILDDNVDLSEPEPVLKPAAVKQDPKVTEPVGKTLTSPKAEVLNTEAKTKVVTTTMSDAERLKQRAERFGVVNEDMKKQLRAERFGGSTKLSTSGSGADAEALKKRAERFGQILSPTLSKADEAEKIQKRKERFGDLTSATNNGPNKPKMMKINTSSAEEEKKKKRAERFGMS